MGCTQVKVSRALSQGEEEQTQNLGQSSFSRQTAKPWVHPADPPQRIFALLDFDVYYQVVHSAALSTSLYRLPRLQDHDVGDGRPRAGLQCRRLHRHAGSLQPWQGNVQEHLAAGGM